MATDLTPGKVVTVEGVQAKAEDTTKSVLGSQNIAEFRKKKADKKPEPVLAGAKP